MDIDTTADNSIVASNSTALDQTASRVQQAAAERINTAASFLREKAATPGVGRIAEPAARGLEQAAHYVESASLNGIRGNATDLVRQYPLQSLAVGAGLGFLLGRALKR